MLAEFASTLLSVLQVFLGLTFCFGLDLLCFSFRLCYQAVSFCLTLFNTFVVDLFSQFLNLRIHRVGILCIKLCHSGDSTKEFLRAIMLRKVSEIYLSS